MLIKGILGRFIAKLVKNPLKRRILVEMADDAVKHELDKRIKKVGGLDQGT